MLKIKSSNKMRNRLFMVYISTFTVLIIVISVTLIAFLSNLMIKEIGASRIDLLRQIGERSNAVKNTSITISNLYNLNPSLLKALVEKSGEAEEDEVKKNLDIIKNNYNTVFYDVGISYEVVIIGENGFSYSSQAGDSYNFDSLKNQLWYKTIYEKQGDITFISSFKNIFGTQKDRYVFSASRTIKDNLGNEVGTLMINIDEEYLYNIYASALNGKNSIYIIDKNGNIISHNDRNMRGLNFIDVEKFRELFGKNEFHITRKSKGDYLISNYYDSQTEWTIIEEMPTSAVFGKVNEIYYIIIIISGICFAIALVVSYHISKKVSRPLLSLCDSMNRVKTGDFDVISQIEGYEEIDSLKESFNSMASEIKVLLETVRKKEKHKRQTERDFLRAQINPHFLYNTLFSIKCMVELNKNSQVIYMITAFIELLKMTLREDTNLISLEEEFSITEKYLILQQIRYGEKLVFEFEIDEETREYMVPALVLQPIVENAIFHGIEAKNDMGIIVVGAKIQDDSLIISIIDDGVGMGIEALRHIQEQCEKKEIKKSRSIGIANVANRIKMDFGDEYGVNIESELGIGTIVRLKLPIIFDQLDKGGESYVEDFDSR